MKNRNLTTLVRMAAAAAIYVAVTLSVAPLSFGAVQFRLSEVLTLLCFYKTEYCYALILGCAISNLFSPLGMLDMFFGVMSTVFSVVGIRYCKKLWTASLFPTISMVFIAWELALIGEPFWFSLLTTAIGEFTVVTLLGVPLFTYLQRNRFFRETILE